MRNIFEQEILIWQYDNHISDTWQATDLIFQTYLDHLASIVLRLLLKIKSLQLHLLAMLVEQMQKKYLNFWVHLTQKALHLDKGTSNKNDISNFRPVSILTTSSKIYEKVTKKLIENLSPFISANRQN